MLYDVLQCIVVIALISLASIAINTFNKFINTIIEKNEVNIETTFVDKMMDSFKSTVTQAIIATNQTYVNSLKKAGKFDSDAMKEAMRRTVDYCKVMLADDVLTYIETNYNNVDQLIEVVAETIIGASKGNDNGDVGVLVDVITGYLSQISGTKNYTITEIATELRSKLGITA